MNAGLGNLTELKQRLLAPSVADQATFDDALLTLGLGVAELLQRHCNRSFGRVAGDTFTTSADRDTVLLPRYPVESVTGLALRESGSSAFTALELSTVLNTNAEAGIVYLAAPQGDWRSQIRITYTGGWWWQTLDPDETGYPATQPTGSTALPADLKLAWFLQCKKVWESFDPLGSNLTGDAAQQAASAALAGLALVPHVAATIAHRVRYAIT